MSALLSTKSSTLTLLPSLSLDPSTPNPARSTHGRNPRLPVAALEANRKKLFGTRPAVGGAGWGAAVLQAAVGHLVHVSIPARIWGGRAAPRRSRCAAGRGSGDLRFQGLIVVNFHF
ncbi:hypothetical protein GUJ93_ZPchr0010g8312 [Zizania palustris]|uniref:Uncharacterized protein n=1 Tax=Zizania palustris TaxID=103762 RepID=A0A8J6BI36_ZIZPA|nr:hypothetical protein GUJ93_ZPchr0010g8312 [Zizania palustris]